MSNRPAMNKANRDRYLSKVNRLCHLYFNGDILVEFGENNTLNWRFKETHVSHWIPFTRQAAIVPRLVYEDIIQTFRFAEANFRMIATTDKMKQELIDDMRTYREDDRLRLVAWIREYDIRISFNHSLDDQGTAVLLMYGCFNKKRPKDGQIFGKIIHQCPTNSVDSRMTTEYLGKVFDEAAEEYRKHFADAVETYGQKFNQDIHPNVRADIADVGVAEGSKLQDTLSTDKGPVVVPSFEPETDHVYYIKKKDGSEEILAGENLNYDLGDIVVDLTKLHGPGKEPNLEEFHKQWSDGNSYLNYAEGKPSVKVIETTEGTSIEPDYNNKFQDSTKDQLPEQKKDA